MNPQPLTSLQALVAIGQIATSLAALVGIGLAIWKVPQELRNWREQRRATLRSEVAGASLVATIRFLRHLKSICSPLFPGDDDPTPLEMSDRERRIHDAKQLTKQMAVRWEGFAETRDMFVTAQERALAYLGDDVTILLEIIWHKMAEIKASQNTVLMMGRQGTQMVGKLWEKAFGEDIDKELDALQARAIKVLRPIAQHD